MAKFSNLNQIFVNNLPVHIISRSAKVKLNGYKLEKTPALHGKNVKTYVRRDDSENFSVATFKLPNSKQSQGLVRSWQRKGDENVIRMLDAESKNFYSFKEASLSEMPEFDDGSEEIEVTFNAQPLE